MSKPEDKFTEEEIIEAIAKNETFAEYAMKRSEEFEDAKETVLALYTQACLIHPNSSDDPIQEFQFDNQCMSAYEYAEEKLIEWGEIKPEQCVRRMKK